MGMDYSARLVVGLPRGEIENTDLIAEDELEVCPPYYDGNSDDGAIAGITYACTSSYSAKEFVWDEEKINSMKAEFKELTGQEAKVYISPCGY